MVIRALEKTEAAERIASVCMCLVGIAVLNVVIRAALRRGGDGVRV